ncbi:MAG: C10 family peptidase [Muribaculaceae bacterium]
MKKLFILTLLLGAWFSTSARQLSVEEAIAGAQRFVRTNSRMKSVAQTGEMQLAYTHSSNNLTNFYVINSGSNGGFVIMSAHDNAMPVLGYSSNGSFDPNNIPPGMQVLFGEYAKEIDYAVANNLSAASATTEQADERAPIAPLCATRWGQSTPFNNMCPPTGSGGNCVTGCTATAMAQVMKHHNWPPTGTGSFTYTTNIYGTSTEISVDFSQATYDWNNMLNVYDSGANEEQKQAVAQLLYHCGASCSLAYGATSGAATLEVQKSLANYFGYDKSVRYTLREFYGIDEWNTLIYNELQNNRVVHMSGFNTKAGHAFVCDGYDRDNFFHINWGWCGLDDGYFKLSALNPTEQGIGGSEDGYSSGIDIVYNIKPDEGGSPTIEGAVYGNFVPDVYTIDTSADHTITFPMTGYFTANIYRTWNLMKLGIMAVNTETNAQTYINSQVYTNIKTGYYYALNDNLKVSSNEIRQKLANGTYVVYPAIYDVSHNLYNKAFVQYGKMPYLNMTVADGSITFTEPDVVLTHLNLESATFNTRLYKGNNYSVTVSISNSGLDYCNRIYPVIYDSEDNVVSKGKPEIYEIATSQTTTHTLINTLPSTITAGTYYFGVIDNSGNPVGEKQEITIKEDTGLYSLSVGIFTIKDSYNVDAANVQMTARVTCSGGYFNGALDAYIYRYGGTSICYGSSEIFDLTPGETKVINFNVPFKKGEVGMTYQAAIFNYNNNRCEKLTALKDFTVGSNSGIENILSQSNNEEISVYPNPAQDQVNINCPDNIEQISIFAISGSEVLHMPSVHSNQTTINISHLTPGIYVMKVTTTGGNCAVQRIVKQ